MHDWHTRLGYCGCATDALLRVHGAMQQPCDTGVGGMMERGGSAENIQACTVRIYTGPPTRPSAVVRVLPVRRGWGSRSVLARVNGGTVSTASAVHLMDPRFSHFSSTLFIFSMCFLGVLRHLARRRAVSGTSLVFLTTTHSTLPNLQTGKWRAFFLAPKSKLPRRPANVHHHAPGDS